MDAAIELGLFDRIWYESQHKLQFTSDIEAFDDYLRKSPYSDISPASTFDTISYYENYPDVYESGMSALEHYISHGRLEGRSCFPLRPLWVPKNDLTAISHSVLRKGRYAVVLHIFYPDFIGKFNDALIGVDFKFDLYITTTNPDVPGLAREVFSKNICINEININIVPNHGRNFGPLLVEFGKKLLSYDYFCHLHSKKSLYSSKEQVQWANFLIEYLVKDKQVLSRALNILESNSKYGIYYPTSFWNLPTWVNHWLKNKSLGRSYLKSEYGIDDVDNFLAYPVGGMFWARTSALKPILEKTWNYVDFPCEPLPADGSLLHVIERIIPKVAKNQGYDQFFYNPSTGQFTDDSKYIFRPYLVGNFLRLKQSLLRNDIISFDIFDTVVKRSFYEPDYAKFNFPSRLGWNITGEEFVKIRNSIELDIRIKKQYLGDVDIVEIYTELVNSLNLDYDPVDMAELEFQIDFEFLERKDVIVDLINYLANEGKSIIFISDTYYLDRQIKKLLSKIGVKCDYELLLSSSLGLRKDNGSMWEMLDKRLTESDKKSKFIHVGDNVCADCQISGDYGISSFHILGPMDKWDAMDFPSIKDSFSMENPSMVLKWGQIVSQIGSNPFI